jgi:signal transduction histidine kinase
MILNNKSTNILIVDDSIEILLVLKESLEKENINIFTTTTPATVIDLCIENDISIALIDVKMPDINGFELLKMLKSNALTDNIVVILMTGYSMSTQDVVTGLSNGAVDYLFKPLDLYITMAKVTSLVALVNFQREIQKKNSELETYQKELFKAIEMAEKNKVIKENFLANMSHEIRTPLNAIVGITHLLKDSEVNPKQEEMIDLLEYSSKSLLGIVNDILESSQIDAGKININAASTDIKDLVQTICNLTRPMAADKGLVLNCTIDQSVPSMIMGDALRLNQIMINLINNAIKFTPSGSIDVFLKLLERREQNVLLELVVKDTGTGIDSSSLDKIFDRFEQIEDKTWQKFGGTGLGLSIVKRLIALMQGKMTVDSELGSGTTFTFQNWFPLAAEEAMIATEAIKPAQLSQFNNVCILLAEDNPINQFVAIHILKSWNIKIDIAENGLEAFEKAQTKDYDLILMDTHMPVMNGNEATSRIRKELTGKRREIPIISFSASVIEHEKNEAKAAGADDFIEKPFDPTVLHHKIAYLTGKRM